MKVVKNYVNKKFQWHLRESNPRPPACSATKPLQTTINLNCIKYSIRTAQKTHCASVIQIIYLLIFEEIFVVFSDNNRTSGGTLCRWKAEFWHYQPGVAAGIATFYGPDGAGFETLEWTRFSGPTKKGPKTDPASCAVGTGPLPRVKRPGHGDDIPFPSSTVIELG